MKEEAPGGAGGRAGAQSDRVGFERPAQTLAIEDTGFGAISRCARLSEPAVGFGDTFDQDYADVYRFAYRMLGHREGAEDVVQEAFLRLARKGMEHLAGEPRRRWLFVVARNLCLSGYRQRAKERTVSIEDCPSFPSSTLDPAQVSQQAERAGMVRQAVARLSPDLREVIVLREYEDMSYEQIAEIVKCPIGTVRSRISRAREELRRFLQPLLEETL